MQLDELVSRIKMRPEIVFRMPSISSLSIYLSGFLMSRLSQDDCKTYEQDFFNNFSSFVFQKVLNESFEGEVTHWSLLLSESDTGWGDFFALYNEFRKKR